MAFGFGNPVSSAPTFNSGSSFGFGVNPPASGTGFNFGTTTTSAAPSTGFSFGTMPAAVAGTGFGFGSTPAQTSAFSFGTGLGTAVRTQAPSFGFGTMNTATTTTPFGQNPFGTGAFGGTTGGFGTSAAPVMSVSASGPVKMPVLDNNIANLVTAVSSPMIYGDERDVILTKWNQLQALWGVGKGYFASNVAPIEFTPDNPYCRFKAVGYSVMPSSRPEQCLVTLVINKKLEEVNLQKQQYIEGLHRCFGSKPNIAINIESVNALSDKVEMVIYVCEKSLTGAISRVQPNEVCAYLEQPTVKPQLAPMGIACAYASTCSKDQLQLYLDNPPLGIDPFLWQQAKADNPNPEKLVPVALIGFNALSQRMKSQEDQIKLQKGRLNIISDDLTEMLRRQANTSANIATNKRKLLELQHKVLKILVQQEVTRKIGFSIQADEEELRVKLEAIQAELSAPTQFKGHLKELISHIRLQNYKSAGGDAERYMMDDLSREQVREHLRMQQEGITHLINIIKDDLIDLKTIEDVSKDAIDKKR